MIRTPITAQHVLRWWLISIVGFIMLACSPKYDWREVRHEEAKWKAIFPGKPVEVSRALSLPDSKAVVTLTLRSAKIDENLFAVGWISNTTPSTAAHLEAAMLANIGAQPESIQRKTIDIDGQQIQELRAKGMMRASPTDPAKEATLWMRTVTRSTPPGDGRASGTQVIEVIALGPSDRLLQADAELFVKSLALLP